MPVTPSAKEELCFLNEAIGVEGGGARFVFFLTDVLKINSFGLQSKGSLSSD